MTNSDFELRISFVIRHSSFVISPVPTSDPQPLMFDPSDDLGTVADGTETVTLLRRGRTPGDAGTVIAHALRRAIMAGEAAIVNTGDVRNLSSV